MQLVRPRFELHLEFFCKGAKLSKQKETILIHITKGNKAGNVVLLSINGLSEPSSFPKQTAHKINGEPLKIFYMKSFVAARARVPIQLYIFFVVWLVWKDFILFWLLYQICAILTNEFTPIIIVIIINEWNGIRLGCYATNNSSVDIHIKSFHNSCVTIIFFKYLLYSTEFYTLIEYTVQFEKQFYANEQTKPGNTQT